MPASQRTNTHRAACALVGAPARATRRSDSESATLEELFRALRDRIFEALPEHAQLTQQALRELESIRALDVDSVPINFLSPIDGTPLEAATTIAPLDCLKVIAVARLMMPDKEIRVCGGREHNLRDLQSWIFAAGANGMMVGNYLTTRGRSSELDLQMIADLGLEVKPCDDLET